MSDKFEDMTFMGHKVIDMTKDGLLQVVKYQQWNISSLEGKAGNPPMIDAEVCEQKINPFPKVTGTPPMPKVKPPKPERCQCLNPDPRIGVITREIFCNRCMLSLPPRPDPLPRKEVISIQPGDVVVLRSPQMLSEKAADHIDKNMTIAFPNSKIVVLEGDMSLGVYREQVESKIPDCPDPPKPPPKRIVTEGKLPKREQVKE